MQIELSMEQELAYVAAFIDAEGHVTFIPAAKRKTTRRIGFTNTDKILFDLVVGILTMYGFEIGVLHRWSGNPKHSPRWDGYLVGGKEAYRRFAKMVPIQHPRKLDCLRQIIEDYEKTESLGRKRQLYRNSRWTDTTWEDRKAHSKKMLEARWGIATS